MYTTIISAKQLQALLNSLEPVQVFDCSFDLTDSGSGSAQFLEGHIPGSIHAHLDRHLTEHSNADRASGGRHPLPTRETLAKWLGQSGLTSDKQVIVYDRQGTSYCGRLWWMLKWCGHEAVAVLDGGWQGWRAIGGDIETGPSSHTPTPERPPYSLGAPLATLVNRQAIAPRLGDPALALIDARASARFRGEVEPLDPVAGHIPGALNRPFGDNFGADGHFKPAHQLKTEFQRLLAGRHPATVTHHCGSGVTAIPNLLAMEIAGLGRTSLFPGSWSEWTQHPELPCAKG